MSAKLLLRKPLAENGVSCLLVGGPNLRRARTMCRHQKRLLLNQKCRNENACSPLRAQPGRAPLRLIPRRPNCASSRSLLVTHHPHLHQGVNQVWSPLTSRGDQSRPRSRVLLTEASPVRSPLSRLSMSSVAHTMKPTLGLIGLVNTKKSSLSMIA